MVCAPPALIDKLERTLAKLRPWSTGSSVARSPRIENMVRQRSLFPAVKKYAGDHDGKFPEGLSDLPPDYISEGMIAANRFLDPKTGQLSDWIYFPGYSEASESNTIILASPVAHGKYRILTRVDGSSIIFTDSEFPKLLKKQPPREW